MEQLGKKTENGKRIGEERIGPKTTEKMENNGKSASLLIQAFLQPTVVFEETAHAPTDCISM